MKTFYKLLIILSVSVSVFKIIQYYYLIIPENEVDQIVPANNPSKITVSVYYEALCPDSRRFILEQLLPAYELIPAIIDIDLIPYGKARTKQVNQELSFSCQHGPTECQANKIHACAIEYTKHDPFIQVKYIACMINDNYNPVYAGKKCASEVGVIYSPISNCSESNMGSLLLKANGERTKALRPKVVFIPTVELDGEHNMPQDEVLQNFFSEVCKALVVKPAECF